MKAIVDLPGVNTPPSKSIFGQMVDNLSIVITRYGKDECSSMWEFYQVIAQMNSQLIAFQNRQERGCRLIWTMTETTPYVLDNCQPKNRSLEEYANILLSNVMDFLTNCTPSSLSIGNYLSVLDQIENALDELGDMIIASSDLSFVDLHYRLGVLTALRDAIAENIVLNSNLGESSKEV